MKKMIQTIYICMVWISCNTTLQCLSCIRAVFKVAELHNTLCITWWFGSINAPCPFFWVIQCCRVDRVGHKQGNEDLKPFKEIEHNHRAQLSCWLPFPASLKIFNAPNEWFSKWLDHHLSQSAFHISSAAHLDMWAGVNKQLASQQVPSLLSMIMLHGQSESEEILPYVSRCACWRGLKIPWLTMGLESSCEDFWWNHGFSGTRLVDPAPWTLISSDGPKLLNRH